MGMYNMMFGVHPLSDVVLATLGLTRNDVGRFRDVYVGNGEIAVYTRNGGGNRDSYQEVFDTLSKHPCYLRDEDDSFDCTYATIYFKFPPEYEEHLKKIENKEPFNPNEKWAKLISDLKGVDRGGI